MNPFHSAPSFQREGALSGKWARIPYGDDRRQYGHKPTPPALGQGLQYMNAIILE
jgi:hypothetical protein